MASRRPRDSATRDPPQPTDIDDRLTAHRRRTANLTRPKDKSERMQSASSTATPTHLLQRPERPSHQQTSPRHTTASPRGPSSPPRHSQEADHEEFSRRLKISSPSPRPSQPRASSSKLFNPDTDPIPTRRQPERERPDDDPSGSYAPRAPPPMSSREDRTTGARQLFDHRKDDPVRFSVIARTQQPSAATRSVSSQKQPQNHVSASSTSSYAPSIASSAFTLSSTTDASSASSAIFDGQPNQSQGTGESGNSLISMQLKRLYRTITALETKVKQEEMSDNADEPVTSRVMLKGKEIDAEDFERDKWKKQIDDHKRLAECIHSLLEISLAPSVPASLRNIPTKYNIIVRLWTYGFHKILESLRQSSFTSPLAVEHLQEFIYYAYTFYTGLLEEPVLAPFKSGWLEALGDLARYKMAVAAMFDGSVGGQGGLTQSAVSQAAADFGDREAEVLERPSSPKSVSDYPAARIDDSPSPSTGIAAARALEVEPEKERWRNIARDWYGAGLSEQPGTGKLHHHLGLLSRDVESEELRAVYHYVKSMTTLHPFSTSRESILPLWSHAAQQRRTGPDAKASELFVLLHGMLFTNIQLDDFQPTLARFIERLDIEGAEEREWIMMGVINITSVLEYGRPTGTLRRVGMVGTRDASAPQIVAAMRLMAKKSSTASAPAGEEERMEVDDTPSRDRPHPQSIEFKPSTTTTEYSDGSPSSDSFAINALPIEPPPAFKYALQLAFAMLSHVLKRPTRKASQFSKSNLNPYLTIMLTFLSTVLKHKPTLEVLERAIPWDELCAFFTTVPRKIMINQNLMPTPGQPYHRPPEGWSMLTSQCPPPLPEDWCLRGMEWVGRKVFERGYWKSGEDRKAELEVLETHEGGELTDGMIEDDDDEGDRSRSSANSGSSDLVRRWIRIVRSAVNISSAVDGFVWKEGTREWSVQGKLAEKLELWKEEDRLEKEEEERRRMGRRWVDDAMDIDDEADNVSDDDSEDNEDDSDEIKALKARRRHLKSLLHQSQLSTSPKARRARASKSKDSRPQLHIIPGYTSLVIDTNILLSSLSIISDLVESLRWTVIIPLPVVMELDGLRNNSSPLLGEAAKGAVDYIASHIRSHSASLKVQTSKGNYLSSLNVRSEEVDFDASGSFEKSMDDLILKAAIWQDDHWVDRSTFLKVDNSSVPDLNKAVRVVLLSLDRNLRLKARSRQLPAASEKDLALIFANTK